MQRVKSYVFGDRYMCQSFKEAVLRSIVEESDLTRTPYNSITHVFANFPVTDPLLRFLVDQHCHDFHQDHDSKLDVEDLEQLPQASLIRVMLQYSKIVADVKQKPLRAKDYLTINEAQQRRPALTSLATNQMESTCLSQRSGPRIDLLSGTRL